MLAAVITVSDRASRGEREDVSGPLAARLLAEGGWANAAVTVVPDGAAQVAAAIEAQLAAGARLIITTGGTGISSRDRTPEGTRQVLDRELPGIAEELRRIGAAKVPTALLSRGLVGIANSRAGGALVVNLPGSTGGVRDGVPLVLSLVGHIIEQLDGGDH